MSQEEITKRIRDSLLHRHIAFGGLVKKDEVVLKGDLETISSDLTHTFIDYLEEMTLKQIKAMIKDIFS